MEKALTKTWIFTSISVLLLKPQSSYYDWVGWQDAERWP